MLVRKELLSPEWAERILSWPHSGFSVHSRIFIARVTSPYSRQGASDGPILRPLCERPSGEGQEGEPKSDSVPDR